MLTALFPIGDDNEDRLTTPWVTYLLVAVNVFVFVFLQLPSQKFTYGFAVIPYEILHGRDLRAPVQFGANVIPQAPGPFPIYLTILSSMFMHGGWSHLLGNMLYLWIFGDNVEDAMGHVKFILFYLICGATAALTQTAASQYAGGLNLFIPSLGASGAIAGVLGAYLVLYPTRGVRVLVGWIGVVVMPAIIVIGLWIGLQVMSGIGDIAMTSQTSDKAGGVAYWAHIGGAVAGLVLVWFFRSPRVTQRAQARRNLSSGRYYGY